MRTTDRGAKASQHHGVSIRGPLKPTWTSRRYDTEGLKVDPYISRGVSISVDKNSSVVAEFMILQAEIFAPERNEIFTTVK